MPDSFLLPGAPPPAPLVEPSRSCGPSGHHMNVPDRSRVEWIRVITEFWRWTGRPRNLLRTYCEIPICIVNIAALGGAKGRRMDDATMQRLQELSDREA